ncbi:Endonuclease/exonuclease/phosphatase [Tricharina praecox]|uniref:Endonuclease/exonuclease/phosphatase n=1 Tax=Tricharina praecox TaxID=43433 RepID=UPI00221F5127|nr:Endonuclease/exonuclease/phosphatase [Tricharina praecox]KAI5856448.1 Endonuclease/exonuclease/phosphatase [Tricharina praecox]
MSPPVPLTLYLLTLNCALLPQPPTHLSAAITPTLPTLPPALLLLSLQELAPISASFVGGPRLTQPITALSSAVSAATRSVYGAEAEFELLGWCHVGPTALLAFTPTHSAAAVADVRWASTGLGVGLSVGGAGVGLGNKGAVAVRLLVDGVEITAVAVHFAAHEGAADRRDRDWADMVRTLVFSSSSSDGDGQGDGEEEEGEQEDVQQIYPTTANGHLFVFGDLNYRTSDVRPKGIVGLGVEVPPPNTPRSAWRSWLDRDQLTARRRAGLTCHGLEEAPVTFPPTYKYDLDAPASDDEGGEGREDVFVQNRWPSWTDRVLFLPSPRLEVMAYDSIPSYKGSDHQPVFAVFSIQGGVGEGGGEVVSPPFGVDENWRLRRAVARRGELVVGAAMVAAESAGVCGVLIGVVLVLWGGWWALGGAGAEM